MRMSGGGDPLFHSGILDFLDHLDARGVLIDNLTTNGALLGPEIARRLVARAAREVIFSVNAVDDQDYHRMMQVPLGTFGRVLANIRGLLAERGAAELPSVVVQFLVDRDNFREIPRMYALGRDARRGPRRHLERGGDPARPDRRRNPARTRRRAGDRAVPRGGSRRGQARQAAAAGVPDRRVERAARRDQAQARLRRRPRNVSDGPELPGGERALFLFLVHGDDSGQRRPVPLLPPDAAGLQAARQCAEREVRGPLGGAGVHADAARAAGDSRRGQRGAVRSGAAHGHPQAVRGLRTVLAEEHLLPRGRGVLQGARYGPRPGAAAWRGCERCRGGSREDCGVASAACWGAAPHRQPGRGKPRPYDTNPSRFTRCRRGGPWAARTTLCRLAC